ncbi:MAG: DUF2520 domain-containing protein, partial [Nocardioidaceae bacterium]
LDGCFYGATCSLAEAPLAHALIRDLGGIAMWVEEADRELYHAALAHGANHLVTLVSQAMQLLSAAGATDPAATLRPLLTAALDNALDFGDAALTGPIVRGDVQTVRAHLRSLSSSPISTLESYVVMARATAKHALADGRLEPRRAAALMEALDDALIELRS